MIIHMCDRCGYKYIEGHEPENCRDIFGIYVDESCGDLIDRCITARHLCKPCLEKYEKMKKNDRKKYVRYFQSYNMLMNEEGSQ